MLCAGFVEGDRATREEREDREAYRRDCKYTLAAVSVGPSTIPPRKLPIMNLSLKICDIDLSVPMRCSIPNTTCLVCFVMFSDGSGDKKAATGAGADFNPEFVSV